MALRKKLITIEVSQPVEVAQIILTKADADAIKQNLGKLADELSQAIKKMTATRLSPNPSFIRFGSYGKRVQLKSLVQVLRDAATTFKFEMSSDEINKFNQLSTLFVSDARSFEFEHKNTEPYIYTAMIFASIFLLIATAALLLATSTVALVIVGIVGLVALGVLVGSAIAAYSMSLETPVIEKSNQASVAIKDITTSTGKGYFFQPKWEKSEKDQGENLTPATQQSSLI